MEQPQPLGRKEAWVVDLGTCHSGKGSYRDWDEERRVLGNLDVVRPEVRDEERQLHGEVQGGRRALGQ